jgi:hypothetical protein
MKTPEEILDEVAAENMINIQQMVTTKQLAIIAMKRYAKLYHDSEVKKLNIPAVIKSLSDLDGKIIPIRFTVKKGQPNIHIDDI